jgi:hypothetical protein
MGRGTGGFIGLDPDAFSRTDCKLVTGKRSTLDAVRSSPFTERLLHRLRQRFTDLDSTHGASDPPTTDQMAQCRGSRLVDDETTLVFGPEALNSPPLEQMDTDQAPEMREWIEAGQISLAFTGSLGKPARATKSNSVDYSTNIVPLIFRACSGLTKARRGKIQRIFPEGVCKRLGQSFSHTFASELMWG